MPIGEKRRQILWRLDSAMGGKDANAHTLAVKEMIPGKHLSETFEKNETTLQHAFTRQERRQQTMWFCCERRSLRRDFMKSRVMQC